MKVGLIGLGKMGCNLALNMIDHNIDVIGYDKFIEESSKLDQINYAQSIRDLVVKLDRPRIVWMMVPSGDITEAVVNELFELLDKDDILIDGGNSHYKDSMRRHQLLKEKQIHFLDVGTSGGTTGARNGACLMIGGKQQVFEKIESLFKAISIENGYDYMGQSGAGHFVKMVHNGIEYGMMQAIGEGFDVLEASPFDFDYRAVSKVWANGSIIEGLLMDMVESAFAKDPHLDSIEGKVDNSGEGQWTVEEALKLKVSTPVIAQALFTRYKSKDEDKFAERIVAAMRQEFGGHKTYKNE
jgi:6-phosphogluconate dehydrogenase